MKTTVQQPQPRVLAALPCVHGVRPDPGRPHRCRHRLAHPARPTASRLRSAWQLQPRRVPRRRVAAVLSPSTWSRVPSWGWMEPNLKAYGLRSFLVPSTTGYKGKNEPWHIQPAEIPASRSLAHGALEACRSSLFLAAARHRLLRLHSSPNRRLATGPWTCATRCRR